MVIPVCAAEVTPRVTFENVKNTNPDLYISKQVENADDRYEMPDIRFTFTLKLKGALAENVNYRVYDASGNEVFNYEDGESTEDKSGKIPFKTTRSGNFTLLGGQTARFEYVGQGTQYEVVEREAEGWTQIHPAAGTSLKGTVEATGSSAVFTNLYEPVISGHDTADFKVVKNISYPEGYELPEKASFGFVLKIGGKAYANQEYTVTDNKSGQAVSTGRTDSDGRFVIPQNSTAQFPSVDTELDYEITEEPTEGWRTVGNPVQQGAVKGPITTVHYTNAKASFVVSKTLENGISEDSFTFTLTNNKNNVWKNASYYLYEANGKLVDKDVKTTGDDGTFQLKAGQSAMFIGMPAGTVYSVKEDAKAGYVQKVPTTVEGYTNMVVTDSVEKLIFVNALADTKGILSVTKKVQSTTGEEPLQADTFTFVLKTNGEEQTPVPDAIYSVAQGEEESTFKTNKDGQFTLKANETARFQELASGEYVVEEIQVPAEYSIEGTDSIQWGTLGKDGLSLTFTNKYTPQVLSDLIVHKEDTKGQPLEGATFGLFAKETLTDPIATATSDKDGKLQFNDLRLGTYYLAETAAPEGYVVLKDAIKVEMKRDSREKGFELFVNGESYGKDDSKDAWFKQVNEDTQSVHIRVKNKESVKVSYAFGAGEHPDVTLPEETIVEKGTTNFQTESPSEDSGYTFDGWFYDQNCEKPFESEKAINKNLILYGKWTAKTLTVTYHWVEGTETPTDVELPETQTVRKYQPYTAERVTTAENWYFMGWYTDPECKTLYVDRTILQDNLDLYGKWQKVDAVLRTADVTAYTGGASMHKSSFPTPRFVLTVNEEIEVEKLTFHTSDEQTFQVKKDELGKEILIPELTEQVVYKNSGETCEDDRIAGIYSIELNNAPITAETKDGQKITVTYTPGQLVVRHVSNPELALTDLAKITTNVKQGKPEKTVKTPTAYVSSKTEYLTNGSENLGLLGTGEEKANIALLHDDILSKGNDPDTYKEMLTERAIELLPKDSKASDFHFQYTYLDLVNTNDGNVWVSSSKGSTIYLPYPEGTDEKTDFLLFHYKGLHREYGIGIVPNTEISIANAELENVKIKNTEYGIQCTIDEGGFSPFGLIWKDVEPEKPEPEKPEPEKPDPEKPEPEKPEPEKPDPEKPEPEKPEPEKPEPEKPEPEKPEPEKPEPEKPEPEKPEPEKPEPEKPTPDLDMPKPEKPQKPNQEDIYTPTTNHSVKTGDSFNIGIWILGMGVAITVIGVVFWKRKKK